MGSPKGNSLPANVSSTDSAKIVSDDDLECIAKYFWLSISSPTGLLRKVWFDLMMHLGDEGIRSQHAMRKETFTLLKSQTDSRRRLQWKKNGIFQGIAIFDEPSNPLCPVKTFQLYICKLDLKCPLIFQKPQENFEAQTSRFWYNVLPSNSKMLSSMMYDISRNARTSTIYSDFCDQILPKREEFYEIFRKAWVNIERFQLAPHDTAPDGLPIAPFKLCQQCLVPVRSNKNDRNNGSKGILCSVICYESFMIAKEMRQQQNPSPGAVSSWSTRGSPSIIRGSRPMVTMHSVPTNSLATPLQPQQIGQNITPEVFRFIQQVARIQACGYPRPDGLTLLFKEDYTPIKATIPKELQELTVSMINSGNGKQIKQRGPASVPRSVTDPSAAVDRLRNSDGSA